MIVLDASVALSWLFEDELDEFARSSAARTLKEHAIVPAIFPAEVANALISAAASKRIAVADIAPALARLAQLPIRIESPAFILGDVAKLANAHKLSYYDAVYLSLAKGRRAVLLTRDKKLANAAKKEKISVETASK